MSKESRALRRELLADYYSNFYDDYLFDVDMQGLGISYFERGIDKHLNSHACTKNRRNSLTLANVLEVGGGDGQHIPYVKFRPENYTLLDIRDINPQKLEINIGKSSFVKDVTFVLGDAANMPFGDNEFDLVFGTCVLHHVDDVLGVLMEAKRVSKKGGEVIFILPTDPGLLNGLVKRLISFRKLKSLGYNKPELIYSLDHRNYVNSIINQFDFVFESGVVTKKFRPFFLPSINSNLYLTLHAFK